MSIARSIVSRIVQGLVSTSASADESTITTNAVLWSDGTPVFWSDGNLMEF